MNVKSHLTQSEHLNGETMRALKWSRKDWIDVALQSVGVVVAGIVIVMIGPYFGAPLITDSLMFYVSAVVVGIVLGYAVRGVLALLLRKGRQGGRN